MPKISAGKFLSNRSKRKNNRINSANLTNTVNALNSYFDKNKYPYRVIDSILSVYVTTYLVERIDSSQDIELEDLIPEIKKELGLDNIRLIPNVSNTSYIGVQIPNPSLFDISYEECFNKVRDTGKLPIGIDCTNELVSLSINELGNTLIVGGPKTRKTTFIKSLVTSLILSKDESNINVILDNSYYHDLSLFSKNCHASNDIIFSLNHIINELDRREKLFEGLTFKKYNQRAVNNDINTVPTLNIFLDQYKSEYLNLVYNIMTRSSALGVNLIISSSTYIPDFSKYLTSCIIFKVDDIETAHLSRTKEAINLIGRGDALLLSGSLKREDPLRLVTPYISDKDIRRLIP